MIASIEVDMNNNSGILYCSPDFMMSIKDFIKHIHIGIQTKGYKEANSGDNLLVHVAFLGRCTTNSRIIYKVFVDQVVELLSSKGIKMIKPLNIDWERLAGLEWNLDKFIEPSITLVPQETLIYKDLKGHTSLRFTDYIPQNSRKSIDEIEFDLDNNLMEIELVKEDKILYPKELEIILDKKNCWN